MLVLALDMGTSSVRALVLDGDSLADPAAAPRAIARRSVTVAVDDHGAGTLDPADYLGRLHDCLDELTARGALDGVTVVATSAQWHSVLPLDARGAPLGPVLTWLDSRPQPAAGSGPADPDGFHRRTGAWWHGLYWTVRLPWLRTQLGPGIARFSGLVEFVLAEVLAESPMSISEASGTGLLDIAALDWDAEACALAGVRAGELPALAPAGWSGRLRPEYARRWPALREARWGPPVGDGAASNAGSGGIDERSAVVTVGTSAAVRLVELVPAGQPPPALPHRLWRYRVDHKRTVLGAAYSNGGNLFAWARRELRLPDGEALEAALAAITPGTGIRADPRLGGDRPPGRTPAGSGALSGIGFATSATDLLAGLMDAVCHQVAADTMEIESTLGRPVEVMLGGGAVAASAWWRRAFRAALAPRPVHDVPQPEVGAIGAALITTGQLP